MAVTKRIRVKRVEAADPQLTVTMESVDGGIFPPYVKVDAIISALNGGGPYPGQGEATGGGETIIVVVPFTDPQYPSQIALNYSLTVYFSSDNVNWAQVPPADVLDSSGTVIAHHDDKVQTEESGGGTTGGAKNKGCLALFGLLPFLM